MNPENNSQPSVPQPIQQLPAKPAQAPQPAQPAQAVAPKNGKKSPKLIAVVIVLLILIGGAAYAGYAYGKSKAGEKIVYKTPQAERIDLPKEAQVWEECVTGRGKQYIIPKDAPGGPFYDVKDDKVIAIEYKLGVKTLLSSSAEFSDTLLLLTKKYPVDHFTIVPVPPKPTDTDQYIHLVMFIVSKKEAESIKCSDTTNKTTDTTSTQSTNTSTDSSSSTVTQ